MVVNSYSRFYPGIDVDYCKASVDYTASFEKAKLEKTSMQASTIYLNEFKSRIEALYFAHDGNTPSNTIATFYRKVPGQHFYQYVCTLDDGSYAFLDYNILSNHFYHYLASIEIMASGGRSEYYIYENTDTEENESYFHTNFDSWTICDIDEDPNITDETVYVKTDRMWELGLNLQDESITQNLGIVSWDTLGRYPKFSQNSKNYSSMSFTGLLGRMKEYNLYIFDQHTDPLTTVEKQVYKYTEKLETFDNTRDDDPYTENDDRWGVWDKYALETDKLNAWKEFISNGKTKLLRDVKGNGWLIQIAGSGTHSIDNQSNILQTTVTFEWKEVEALDKISIVLFGSNAG